jgi:hypothetical protein
METKQKKETMKDTLETKGECSVRGLYYRVLAIIKESFPDAELDYETFCQSLRTN